MYSMIARVFAWSALISLAVQNFQPDRVSIAFLWIACFFYEQHCSHAKKENYNRNRH